MDNPVDRTYLAGTITGAIIFVAGILVLANGIVMRNAELEARRKAEAFNMNLRNEERRQRGAAAPELSVEGEELDRASPPQDDVGTEAARRLFRRIDDLLHEDVRRALRALAPVDQALFLVEWRSLSEKLDSKKGREIYQRLVEEDAPGGHADTSSTAGSGQ